MSNPSGSSNSWVQGRVGFASRKGLRTVVQWWIAAAAVLVPVTAHGQTMPQEPGASRSPAVRPPPINVDFLQFGIAFTGEFNLHPGAICPADAEVLCILGSGGGIAARGGYRSRGPWYVGGAYEFNRVDTRSLMRLGILQQARAESRYYFNLGLRLEPYLTSGVGAVVFGNEWGLETFGATTFGGVGFEVQLSRTTVVGAALVYRPVLLAGWTDRAGQHRPTGVAHFLGFEVVLEDREPLGIH